MRGIGDLSVGGWRGCHLSWELRRGRIPPAESEFETNPRRIEREGEREHGCCYVASTPFHRGWKGGS